MNKSTLRVQGPFGAAPVALIWDPSTYDCADRLAVSLKTLGYRVQSLPMTNRNLRRMSLVDPTRTRVYRRGGSLLALVGNGAQVAQPMAWAELLGRFASAGREGDQLASGIRTEVLVESKPSRNPEESLGRKRPFLDLRKSPRAPNSTIRVRSWSGFTDLKLLTGVLYPPLIEGQVSPLVGGEHLRRRRGPILILDRIGSTMEITDVCSQLEYNIIRLELEVAEPFAIGFIDGIFPACNPAELASRWNRLESVLREPHVSATAGFTEDEERRFRGRRPCERKIRIFPVPAVADRAAPILRQVTDHGANARSVSIYPFWEEGRCLQSIEIVADVETLPPEQRIRLYESLQSIPWLPKGARVTENRARRARPAPVLQITAYRGPVFDVERRFLN